MNDTLIELKDASLVFNNGNSSEVRALDKVNLKIEKGDYITIVGGNGTGKSSLLKTISEYTPTHGAVFYNGENSSKLPSYKRARHIRYVSQNTLDIVADGVSLEAQYSQTINIGGWFSLKKAVTSKVRQKIIDELSKLNMGLENRLSENLSNFSGGERQAISLSMAIANKPDLLLLDEHTAALDFRNVHKIEQLTDRMIKENNIATLWVTHNIEQAVTYGKRIIIMDRGKIVEDIKGENRKGITVERLKNKMKRHFGVN